MQIGCVRVLVTAVARTANRLSSRSRSADGVSGVLNFFARRARRVYRFFVPKPRCCICGGTRFNRGAKGRLSATGKLPHCRSCKSLERHRIFRKILLQLRPERFGAWRCLQFSRDPTVRPEWFASFEVSIYGKANSLDLQKIDRPDESYDVIICNHVLEHVADYRAALRELRRVLSPRGFLLLSFPDPYRLQRTEDWGHPDPEQHHHYRVFGRDVEPVIAAEMRDCQMVRMVARDDVTGTVDMAYVITRNAKLAERARRNGGR